MDCIDTCIVYLSSHIRYSYIGMINEMFRTAFLTSGEFIVTFIHMHFQYTIASFMSEFTASMSSPVQYTITSFLSQFTDTIASFLHAFPVHRY